MTNRITLIGYRGTGKSTVGPLLAQRLDFTLVDSDAYIESSYGSSVADIFAQEGEECFRDRETMLLKLLTETQYIVLATGGGVILRSENRILLQESSFVVWLQASASTIWQRIQADPTTTQRRPNLTSRHGLDEVEHLLTLREPLYRQTAHLEVNTEEMSPTELVTTIVEAWTSFCNSR